MINSVNIDLVEREIQKNKDILDFTKKSDILKYRRSY